MPYFLRDRVRVCLLSGLLFMAPLGFSQVAAVAATSASGGTAHSSFMAKLIPRFGHVFVVVEENHSYSSVIGNSAMPYLNGLAKQYGLATQYYANTHPSIGNYFMMTTGQIITNDDSFMGTVNADNTVRHLLTGGKTWKSYAESLPNVGYTGGDVYPYVRHHNPMSFFSDVVNSRSERNNLVPFTQFASDLKNNQLPQYSFIVPNMLDDAHDGSLTQADNWLKKNIGPLMASSMFKQDGLLVILFDESFSSDGQHGGGQVAAVVISPKAKRGYQSKTLYQHQSLCRLLLQGLGLTQFPGAANKAPQMGEFF
jgi:phosphatidylinositol-3-phosphatase